mmetsp:Transcript_56505/g.50839  ORF Transcript_56505/g.50839 Transcript_56505/m.50839 type:complete len:383 (-) Transcript_56505:14-1162(-)
MPQTASYNTNTFQPGQFRDAPRWKLHNCDNNRLRKPTGQSHNQNDIKVMNGHIESSPRVIVKKDGTVFDGKFVINTAIPGHPNHINNTFMNMNPNPVHNISTDDGSKIGYDEENNPYNNIYSNHNINNIQPRTIAPRQQKLRQKEKLQTRYKSNTKHGYGHGHKHKKFKSKSKYNRCGPTPPRFVLQKKQKRRKQAQIQYQYQRRMQTQMQMQMQIPAPYLHSHSDSYPIPSPNNSNFIPRLNPSLISPISVPSPVSSGDSLSGGSGNEDHPSSPTLFASQSSQSQSRSVTDPNINVNMNIPLPSNYGYVNKDMNANLNVINTDPLSLISQFPDLRIKPQNDHENEWELENANENVNSRIIPITACLDFYIANSSYSIYKEI